MKRPSVSDLKKKINVRDTISKNEIRNSLLVEVSWEVCNQVGGIHTVIKTKVPSIVESWKGNYCLIGPYIHPSVSAIFDPTDDFNDPFGEAVLRMREAGLTVHYGYWLITGKPKVVLFDIKSVAGRLNHIKFELWDHHRIPCPDHHSLLNQVVMFGYMTRIFFEILSQTRAEKNVIAHFHEWMAATALPGIRRLQLPIATVFTTHATILGRYLASNDPLFYEYLPFYNWEKEAIHFNIEPEVKIERAAAHGSHVFTTVSEVTGQECEHLLGRVPDVILPNGINIERFEALHEFQNLHQLYRTKIHEFIMGHFFQSYSFNLDKTILFFTSGRYEYQNKGYDLTLEALARLNWRLRQSNMDVTVVMFFITRRPFHSINPFVLQSRAMMEEIQDACEAITKRVAEKLFYAAATASDNKLPNLNEFVDEHLKLRLRTTIQSWRTHHLPPIVTHNLHDDQNDEILNFLRRANLVNNAHDKVKIVYHPDFISMTNPLFGMEYGQFVRGCHLGIFPSYYEPWGYTPLEAIASGIPAITSDLSGFGDYVQQTMEDHDSRGIFVIKRRYRSFDDAANELCDTMYQFLKQNRRQRIAQRNETEAASVYFGWDILAIYYARAYKMALERIGAASSFGI